MKQSSNVPMAQSTPAKVRRGSRHFRLFLPFAFCLLPLFSSTGFAEGPWGRDAELAHWNTPKRCERRCKTPVLGNVAEVMIRFHQQVISPADGPRSYHKPSSSQYTLDAMRKYGFFRGFLMGCDRLMRENDDPWVYEVVTDEEGDTFKWDPVK